MTMSRPQSCYTGNTEISTELFLIAHSDQVLTEIHLNRLADQLLTFCSLFTFYKFTFSRELLTGCRVLLLTGRDWVIIKTGSKGRKSEPKVGSKFGQITLNLHLSG